ncbi:MAG: ATP-dependent Clp protease ATP-binding subunit, partial [Deltaproteobacteria bacterium]|nr:ATP-dependent Clp protease ATP-binding subunit [Deltaproteobacteria bacterium]
AIAAEIERILAATTRDSHDVLAAMPPAATRIERLVVQVRRPERLDAETRAKGQRASSDALRLDEKRRHLARIGRRVEARARPREREELIAQLETLVGSTERLAILVRGPELAGKTSIIEHVLGKGGASGRAAFAIPVTRFLAGDGSFGEWQTQVEETFRAAELLDAVIYVEDLGGLALERPGSPIDLAGAFAPFLESRRVRFVGEIRDADLDRFEARHRGLSGSLLPLRVPPMAAAETVRVLEATMGVSGEPARQAPTETPKRRLEPDAIRSLVSLVERYLPYRALPGEALRTAHALRESLEVPRRADGTVPTIARAELVRALADRLGLPAALLREDIALPPSEIAAALRKRVIGQSEAIEAVAATLGVVKAGLSAPGKPIATFLFAGPTGTGKTELARALASYLFGSADALARFDMSEFMDPWSSDRLIRGSDREDGLLTRRARERPFSVLLLDEIEKAHPSVFDLLLQVLGEGRLTDARGKTAYFQNTILVMTSNLGARDDRSPLGYVDPAAPAVRSRQDVYLRAVRDHFRPELLNRIDRIVPFRRLEDDEVSTIARLFTSSLERRPGIADPRHTLDLDADAIDMLARGAMTNDGGARALRREIEDGIVVGAARLLARLGPDAERATIGVSRSGPDDRSVGGRVVHHGLTFSVKSKRGRTRAHVRTPLDRITALRRRLGRWCQLSSVESTRADCARLVAELARAASRRATPQEVASLEQRLGFYGPRLEKLEQLRRELEATEDLALAAFVAEEDFGPLRDEAERIASGLELALYDVASSWISSDEYEITLTAVGAKRLALELFMESLLTPTDGLALSLEWHFPPGVGPADPEWPSERGWGPLRSPEEARTILRSNARFTDVYAFLAGRDAYLAFTHFTGLVRIVFEGQKLGVLIGEPDLSPYVLGAKPPEITNVPSTSVLELDFDRGEARVSGDEEIQRFAGRRWSTCLPRLALTAQARAEGL